ncbi:type IV leader peptidase family protein [Yersinia rochesterensis]|uniref:Prepilin leader peptidase/N-methyltransferase n=2 Tax=Yersinia rochesterensis TaxID=1604335 RepID=A0ABM5SJ49_9GAMM|nr:A24 family peptidase [Yersinia rochesterensis]AIN20129.1 type IV leader peptidase family protein [Yersinia rochesterensis]AJI88189.1 type IV leader peptidase family protein [Yersinia frederiksenii Y225]AJJ34466.1 type IV leader peptidase family protein [Yersinia rochesterensis]CRY65850.1 prepilin peptidase [Yersinia kristensenii]
MTDMHFLPRLSLYIFLGLCVGSFLNVIIYRLPIMLLSCVPENTIDKKDSDIFKCGFNLCLPRSFCSHCYSPLPLRYNIPILGWLFLQGVTKCCNRRINPRYIIVELLTTFLTPIIGFIFQDTYLVFCSLLLVWALIVLTFIDLSYYILPDCITMPLLWCGLILNINDTFSPLSFSVFGAVIGYLFLWSPYWIFKLLKDIDSMGHGDFKLMAALGAWFGITAIPFLVLISSSLGIIAYIFIDVFSNEKRKFIAFGPYISLSGIGYIFWGEYITSLLF